METQHFCWWGETVQPAEHIFTDTLTHRQMDAKENITSTANVGGKNGYYPSARH